MELGVVGVEGEFVGKGRGERCGDMEGVYIVVF